MRGNRKKKVIRVSAVLMTLLIAMALMCGCQGKNQSSTNTSTGVTTEVTTSATTEATTSAATETPNDVTKEESTSATTEAVSDEITEGPTSDSTATPTSVTTEEPSSNSTEAPTNAPEPEKSVGLHVEGTKIKTADGKDFVMRGINHAHCWYKNEDEKAFDAIANTGANCIRIVLANGVQWSSDNKDSVQKLLQAAKSRGMVAVLEVHDGTGNDDLKVLDQIVDFWVEMAPILKGTESYCIVNIANEWVGSWDANTWSKGYTTAIPKLRAAGIENLLMIDAAGWGQYGESIKLKGTQVFESDPLCNTMFSIHMYGTAGGSEQQIRNNLEGVTNNNLCVCVGEFGFDHSDGDVKEDYLMQYCVEKGIGYIAWSWKGNSGGVEYLDLSLDWEGKNLSKDWGEKVVNGQYGIKATAKKILD